MLKCGSNVKNVIVEGDRMSTLKGMRQSEIEPCAACGRGMGHSNQMIFYKLEARHMLLDVAAINRAHGMEQMMGGGSFGAMVQQTLGRDEDLANEVSNHSICVCLECSIKYSLACLIEVINENKEKTAVCAGGSDQAS